MHVHTIFMCLWRQCLGFKHLLHVLWHLRYHLQEIPTYFEEESLTDLEIINWLRLIGQWLPRAACLYHPSAWITCGHLHTWLLYMGLGSQSRDIVIAKQVLYFLSYFSDPYLWVDWLFSVWHPRLKSLTCTNEVTPMCFFFALWIRNAQQGQGSAQRAVTLFFCCSFVEKYTSFVAIVIDGFWGVCHTVTLLASKTWQFSPQPQNCWD